MNRLLLIAALSISGAAAAADAPLPERRIDSVSAMPAESSAPVATDAAVPTVPAPAPRVNVSQWLELQSSGRVASPMLQGQTPTEQELANQRLLDSYKTAIPAAFPSGAASSSGGNNVSTGSSR